MLIMIEYVYFVHILKFKYSFVLILFLTLTKELHAIRSVSQFFTRTVNVDSSLHAHAHGCVAHIYFIQWSSRLIVLNSVLLFFSYSVVLCFSV